MSYVEKLGHEVWLDIHSLLSRNVIPLHELVHCIVTSYPCSMCREHFKTHVRNKKVSNLNCVQQKMFMFHLHNTVNNMKNKPMHSPSILKKYKSSKYDARVKECLQYKSYSERLLFLHEKYKKHKLSFTKLHHG